MIFDKILHYGMGTTAECPDCGSGLLEKRTSGLWICVDCGPDKMEWTRDNPFSE